MRHAKAVQLIPDDITGLEPVDADALLNATAGDLKQWQTLGARCAICSREGWLNVYEISRDFGSSRLLDLQRLLHCSRCDNREGNKFIVGKMARD